MIFLRNIAFIGINTSFDQRIMAFLSCCFCILSKLVLSGNTDVFKKEYQKDIKTRGEQH